MYYIIYNPEAGSGNGLKVAERVFSILKERNISYYPMKTEYAGHATELARKAVSENAPAVIVIGGDGTLSETVRGLYGGNTALGIIAAGTGNDFIKSAGIPRDTLQALQLVLSEKRRKTDVCLVNSIPFINECGTGFDVMVLDYAEKAKRYAKGMFPYLWGVLRTIIHFKSMCMTYSIDGDEEVQDDLLVFAAGNGGIIGGGIPICPKASIEDGKMDIVIVKHVPKYKMPIYLLRLLKGKVLEFKETTMLHAQKVTVKNANMRMNVDGEIISMDHAVIEIAPSALWVYR